MPFPLSSALLPISCWLSKATFQGGQKPLSVFSHVSQESQQNGCAKRIEHSLSPLWLVLPFLSPDSHTKTYIVLSYFHSNLTGFPTPIPPSPYCKFIDLQHCRRTRLESSCHCFSFLMAPDPAEHPYQRRMIHHCLQVYSLFMEDNFHFCRPWEFDKASNVELKSISETSAQ